ncbi:hypothetical protein SLS58_000729 [Diplodia intermedia]|uniref:Autophagy-related protein 14 n=1 Tax=Diplodia intermedia TaxID=856260 RepID=A0ABR3U499_9PEZI
MDCDLCGNELTARARVHCPTCARAALYPYRIEQATTLLDREKFAQHVEAVVNGTEDRAGQAVSLGETLVDTHECSKRVAVERDLAAKEELQERMRLITEQTDLLKRQIEETRREIAARKAAIAQRHSDLESASYNVDKRRAKDLSVVKEVIGTVKHADDIGHREDIRSKVWHCKHAADIAGLKQRRRRSKDGQTKMEYYIGGVRIYDLRDLNPASPTQVTTSLTLLAGLVVRVANYLAVRLPAEITLPHKDYPLPTIFSPSSSYTHKDVPFPGTTPISSSSNSPTASRTFENQKPRPRPRPLYIDRKLPALANEDPTTYALFVEGVTFLAWDIAWLCRSQGQVNAFTEWEEICPMGKNMFKLLVDDAQATLSALEQEAARKAEAKSGAPARSAGAPDVVMGYFSHGMSKGFLGSAEGTNYMKGWRFQTAMKAVDRVKGHLQAEMQGAEWEVLDEKEWEMDEETPQGVDWAGEMKKVSSGTKLASAAMGNGGTDEGQGKARGWTKLKSGSDEVR